MARARLACCVLLAHLALRGRALVLRAAEEDNASGVVDVLRGCWGVECLQRYCAFKDGAYSWKVAAGPAASGTTLGLPWTSHRLRLSSLRWMPKATGLSSWQHTLEVVVPDSLTASSAGAGWAVLLINEDEGLAREFAVRTGLIAVSLSDTPPARMRVGGPISLPQHEETVKASSWVNFAHFPDQPWPLEMPTVKAVVRAMDAVAEFSQSPPAGSTLLQRQLPPVASFAVSGWSKRAIATFMAGAVDPRVRLIVPVSHPVNLNVQGLESYENLGETVAAAKVYDGHGVYRIDGADFARLDAIIDPVHYLDRLTMPKLVLLGGTDAFFAPDSTRSWWGQLPSPKSFFMDGGCGHSGFVQSFKDVATSFIAGTVHKKAMPMIKWNISAATGDITVRQVSDHTPLSVVVWWADSPTGRTRDFREASYSDQGLAAQPGPDGRSWAVHAEPPKSGWRAVFAEFVYPPPVPGTAELRLSTEVSVVPSTRPFPPDPDRANYIFR